jgi:hypothetical protein
MAYLKGVRSLCAAALVVSALGLAMPAQADPDGCQKIIASQLRKFKKTYLKAHNKCLKLENAGSIPGPCPDATANAKIQQTTLSVTAKIAEKCTASDLATLGFATDCAFEASPEGAEAACAALPVLSGPDIDPTLLAECLECWKAAELSEYTAILHASHAVAICAGTTSAQSTVCSDLDCTTPLPDQRDLTGGEGDCQIGIAKGGFKYILKREKILEKCALDGGTQASCLGDPEVQLKLGKAEQSKTAKIKRKCGNRDPAASTPFCCRTGMGNQCTAAATREDCEILLGDVQEDKICGVMGDCDPLMGNKKITWWTNCPESNTCPGTALTTLDDLIGCVDDSADAIADELLCLQFPRNGGVDWPCPPSD